MFDALIEKPRPRRWQTAVIIGSAALHAGVLAVVVVGAMWRIEKLEFTSGADVTFRVPPPPGDSAPPPGAEKLAVKSATVKPIKVKPPIVQPTIIKDPDPTPTGSDTGSTDPNAGAGGTGGTGDDPTATGQCLTPPCLGDGGGVEVPQCEDLVDNDGDGHVDRLDPACKAGRARESDDPTTTPPIVPPHVAKGLRIAGNEQIHPPEMVRIEMLHQGKDMVQATIQVCVSARGAVDQLRVLKSTGYRSYDETLTREMREWRYKPYRVSGVPSPMCTVAVIIYRMRK